MGLGQATAIRNKRLQTIEKNPGPAISPVHSTLTRYKAERSLRKGKKIVRSAAQKHNLASRARHLKALKSRIV
jgi:hypothetical protein